jgi:hypothetical protein
MTAVITAIVIFGLALIFWAITASDAHPARRASGATAGVFALLIAALLGVTTYDRRICEGFGAGPNLGRTA